MFRIGANRGATNMFRKGIATATKASKSLGGAGKALSSAVKTGVDVGNVVLQNPAIRSAVATTPEGQRALQFANKAAGVASGTASILKAGSTLVNPAKYKPIVNSSGRINPVNVEANVATGLQRAKKIAEKGESLYNFVR